VAQTLIVYQDRQHHGWRCLDGNNLGMGRAQEYSVCSARIVAVALREALVNEVLRNEGCIEPIEPVARLVSHDGVEALLPYR
jgi:hypothetical protein